MRICACPHLTYFDEGAAGAQQLKYRGTVERQDIALEAEEPPVREDQPLEPGYRSKFTKRSRQDGHETRACFLGILEINVCD